MLQRTETRLPAAVLIAVIGIGVHTFNHVSVAVQDLFGPFHFNPGTIYHPVSAVLYAWLAVVVHSGRNWGRVVISVLLAGQFVGRFFVFQAYPAADARADLVTGWTLSIVVAWLLWVPKSSRGFFG